VASATFAKDHELSADLVALSPPGKKCHAAVSSRRPVKPVGRPTLVRFGGRARPPAGEPLPKNGNRNKKAAMVTLT
jgi:hypothetical protein